MGSTNRQPLHNTGMTSALGPILVRMDSIWMIMDSPLVRVDSLVMVGEADEMLHC